MTPYLLVFGGAFVTFALLSGMAGPGLTDAGWRWLLGAGGAVAWLAFYGLLNGLRVHRAMPKLKALSDVVGQIVPSLEGRGLRRAIDGSQPALVLFWSEDDLASLRVSPLLADVLAVLKGRLTVGRVNVGRFPDLATDHGIVRLPTLVIYADGQERARFVGLLSPKRLRAALEPYLT